MDKIIMQAVVLGVMVAAFLTGKYVFPNIPKSVTDKLNTLSQWAAQFVIWAREFMKSETGEEKMAMVVQKLKEIADEAGIKVTEDQLKAIAQAAYEAMMAGQKEADMTEAAKKAAMTVAAPTAATVIINAGADKVTAKEAKTAILTDEVPEGALDENTDGTVNVYDEDGKKTGTVDKKVAEAAAVNVDVIITEK